MSYQVVNWNMDTEYLNVQGKLPEDLSAELDKLQAAARDVEMDIATPWSFLGQTLFIKPHGSGKQWRWILTCGDQYLHLDLGLGKLNGNCAKVRLSSLLLHEKGPGEALGAVYNFLLALLGDTFTLQVSEVHLCADIADWSLQVADMDRFVTRSRTKTTRTESDEESENEDPICSWDGRRLVQIDFSKTAPHSCCIYDKTRQVKRQHKEWFHAVWKQHGWDGASRITRVEFRYAREWLHDRGIECPYELLDQVQHLWAYSSQEWLRHTSPDSDTNQSRWATSDVWDIVQAAHNDDDATPIARDEKIRLDAERAKANFVGHATSWAVRAVALHIMMQDDAPVLDKDIEVVLHEQPQTLPLGAVEEDGGGFLAWAYDAMQDYLKTRKEATFVDIMQRKALKLGVPLAA